MAAKNQINEFEFQKYFKPPYTVDNYSGSYVWCNDETQMVFDFYSEEISPEEEQRIRALIEGREAEPFTDVIHNDETISLVKHNHTVTILSVRGWGYLTGRLGFDSKEAVRIQDQMVEFFTKLLKGEANLKNQFIC